MLGRAEMGVAEALRLYALYPAWVVVVCLRTAKRGWREVGRGVVGGPHWRCPGAVDAP